MLANLKKLTFWRLILKELIFQWLTLNELNFDVSENKKNIFSIKLYSGFKRFYVNVSFVEKQFFV